MHHARYPAAGAGEPRPPGPVLSGRSSVDSLPTGHPPEPELALWKLATGGALCAPGTVLSALYLCDPGLLPATGHLRLVPLYQAGSVKATPTTPVSGFTCSLMSQPRGSGTGRRHLAPVPTPRPLLQPGVSPRRPHGQRPFASIAPASAGWGPAKLAEGLAGSDGGDGTAEIDEQRLV